MSAGPWTIVHVDTERGFSGGEVQVFLLMRGLADAGHHNVLVCPPASRAAVRAKELGIECVEMGMRNDFDLRAIARLTRELRSRSPDIVQVHTGRATRLGVWAARRAGVPIVSTRRMDRRVRTNPVNRWIHNHGLDRTVAISEPVRAQLIEAGVLPSRVALIPEAVDPERIATTRSRDDVRAELGVEPDELLILFAGGLIARKGVDVLLSAYARLARDDLHLAIAGQGNDEAALREQARDSARVHWLGQRSDVADYLRACDLFCMPSRREGLGVAALEAMGAGRAIVASAVGGLGWIIEHGESGWLVPPDDVDALAAAIAALADDPVRRGELERGAAARAQERYSAVGMVAAYARLYAEVLGARAVGPAG